MLTLSSCFNPIHSSRYSIPHFLLVTSCSFPASFPDNSQAAFAEMAAPSHAQLRYAVFEYLQAVVKGGSLSEEQTESLEVAVQCLSEAFGFSTEAPASAGDSRQHELSLKPLTLPVIFNAGVQVLSGSSPVDGGKAATTAAASTAPEQQLSPAAGAAGASPAQAAAAPGAIQDEGGPDDHKLFQKFMDTLKERGFFAGLSEGSEEWEARQRKARAKFDLRSKAAAAPAAGSSPGKKEVAAQDELRHRLAQETKRMEDAEAAKTKGNAFLAAKNFADAVSSYSEAVRLWPTNAVYYSNRAAAYTHMQMYEEAIADCTKAVELKPDFSKAYSRLGTAHFQATKRPATTLQRSHCPPRYSPHCDVMRLKP